MNNETYLRAAIELAKTAGGFLKRFRDEGNLKIEEKGSDFDFVTNADKTSQRMICDTIRERFPSHGFIGEEDGMTNEEIAATLKSRPHDYFWVVDPLDGTLNYIRGLGSYSVSIALVRGENPIIGAIYAPVENELFTAEVGKGSYLNGRRLAASPCERLHNALIIPSVPPTDTPIRNRMIDINAKVSRVTLNSRTLGSAAREISYVAAGGAEAYFEYGIHPWDVAAGILMASEAGAAVSSLDGGHYDIWNTGIVVAAKGIHKALIEAIDFG